MHALRRLRLAVSLTVLGGLALAQGDVLTPQTVADLRLVTSAALSPDGSTIAYTRAVQRKPGVDEDGAAWIELHVIGHDGGAPRPFVTGQVNVGSVSWTPDGKGIAFTAKRDGDKGSALYILPVDGGEARRAVALESSIRGYSIAPDGVRVALLAQEPEDAAAKARAAKGFKQEIYEESAEFTRLWVSELDAPAAQARRLDIEGNFYSVEWGPVGERLLVSRAPTPLVDDQYMRQSAAIVSAADGALEVEFDTAGKLGHVEWSPDGARVALITAGDINDPNASRLWIGDAVTGALFDALPEFAADVDAIAWQDADTVMYIASHGCETAFEKVDVGAGRGENRKVIFEGGPVLTGLSLSDDGQRGAYVGSAAGHPPELLAMSHGEAAPRRLTDSNPGLADLRLAPQEVVRFKARDGLELEGVLIRPLDEVAGQRYPLILSVHGGPEAHEQDGWQTYYSKPGQVAAARGFAVFYPNYRGSTGRGVEFSKLSQGDPAGKEFDDLVDAVDHLVAIGLVDRDKVGITGGSYGGYATAWCSTRYSERFAAGVMFVGISDKLSKVGTTDIPNEEFYVHALHRPWENWQFFLERSPIYHADGAKTPLIILGGKDDPRVDPGQSRELYRHLKLRGAAPVRLVQYPGEGHGNRKACARYDYNLRMLQWMEHYLQGPGGEMPDYELDYGAPEVPAGP